ncbi:heme lyase CcmF/NrfE family subunit [Rehaibacterium terrae]|jgi:cytochrome c-type biogenesis protein CcmF|uniref:Cytochrome c-type biogenesis protein CcmF n=1 Tax=Rehaibacterium terrae TaxID=1341696 RepID=A0A7W7XXM8_9GAMM|nr:heme lyase CcmF/NrfE family subunit [Rehaibacterium terrae]MBB5014331.1 cytochrome c-type biogenesis protein CcmF [Rehaibacterium terrae]
MLPELGQFALILALVVAFAQTILPLAGAQRGHEGLMRVARPAAWGQFVLLAISFALLTWAFIAQDFSVAYVAHNSNSLLPMQYRFSAVWGAHEGSLLLWVLILAGWSAAVAHFSRSLPLPVVARVLGIMGVVSIGFLLFTILTSNPFERLLPAAPEGRDLNPLLQDPGLIFHPPMLYMGYVGFAVAFAFAIAALIDGKVDARWVRWSRPWTNVAWGFLTLGIALGSWWAYYELGWGGWWFWDPVENASFMPWLAGAALIHSQAVTEKRGSFRGWTLLLAIAAFSLSLLGTFLVRSGVLTSVHAFASDPERGMFILLFLGFVVGGSLLLYALRAPRDDTGAPFAASSRETLLLVNNLLLTAACAMVLIGTLFPLFADALDLGKFSVGPPYFGLLFTVLMAPLVMLVPFGPLTRWQREQPDKPLRMLAPWAGLALMLGVIAFFAWPEGSAKTAFGILGAAWVLGGTLRFVWQRLRTANGRFTAEMLGMTLAHFGIGLFVAGVLVVESTKLETDVAVTPGQTVSARGYDFRFLGVEQVPGPNYLADRGHVVVTRNGRMVADLWPEKRAYASGGQVMTEAAIDWGLMRDVYVALGEPLDPSGESWAMRLYVKPMIRWIWLGALLMALGGFVAAADRRFRRAPKEDSA